MMTAADVLARLAGEIEEGYAAVPGGVGGSSAGFGAGALCILEEALRPVEELRAAIKTALHSIAQVRRTVDGSQPKDVDGCVWALDAVADDLEHAYRGGKVER